MPELSLSDLLAAWSASAGPVPAELAQVILEKAHCACRLLSPPDDARARWDAEDLGQDVALSAIASLTQFRGRTEKQLNTWIHRIADNAIKNWVAHNHAAKRDSRRETASASGPMVAIPVDFVDTGVDDVLLVVQRLSAKYRLILRLRFCGMSFPDIGQKLGLSAESVRMIHRRAATKLTHFGERALHPN